MSPWLYLSIAIGSEVAATLALKASNEFTKLTPSVVVVIGYASAFYFLSLTLRQIPVGVAYAVWCGAGILLVALISWLVFDENLTLTSILGMTLIVAGVALLQFANRSV